MRTRSSLFRWISAVEQDPNPSSALDPAQHSFGLSQDHMPVGKSATLANLVGGDMDEDELGLEDPVRGPSRNKRLAPPSRSTRAKGRVAPKQAHREDPTNRHDGDDGDDDDLAMDDPPPAPRGGAVATKKTGAAANRPGKVTKPGSNTKPKQQVLRRRSSDRLAAARAAAAEAQLEEEEHEAPRGGTRANGRRKPLASKSTNIAPATSTARGKKKPAAAEIVIPDSQPDPPVRGARSRGGRGARAQPRAGEAEEEGDTITVEAPPPAPPRRGQQRAAGSKRQPAPRGKAQGRGRAAEEAEEADENEEEIPETHFQQQLTPPDSMEIDPEDESSLPAPPPAQPTRGRKGKQQRQQQQKSVDEAEGPSAALRRELAKLVEEHESLQLKYRELYSVGVEEAQHNYDKLKRLSHERANGECTPPDNKSSFSSPPYRC